MSEEERAELGKMGRAHIDKNYNFNDFCDKWVKLMDQVTEQYGSWETRKIYKPYGFKEIV